MKKISRKFTALIAAEALLICVITSSCSLPFVQKTLTDLQKVERQFPVINEIVRTLASFAAPEYAAQVTAIAAQIEGDVSALDQLLVNYQNNLKGVTPGDLQKILALVTAVQSQLPQILPVLHVTDSESVKYANAVVGAIGTVLAEIAALLPSGTAAGVAAQSGVLSNAPATAKIITDHELKKQFNAAQHKVHI